MRGNQKFARVRASVCAPLPHQIEELALRLAWPIVLINLVGTAFGFWYYRFQLSATPIVMWPWVPDSPLATLFMAMSLALWRLGRPNEVINLLAFYGNIKLGLWTPFTLLVFRSDFAYLDPAMYHFLLWSHLLMVAQAFLIHRYSSFPVWAIVVALSWYTLDLVVDFFIPIRGGPHHTWVPTDRDAELWLQATAGDVLATAAVVLTIWITVLAFLTHLERNHAISQLPDRSNPDHA